MFQLSGVIDYSTLKLTASSKQVLLFADDHSSTTYCSNIKFIGDIANKITKYVHYIFLIEDVLDNHNLKIQFDTLHIRATRQFIDQNFKNVLPTDIRPNLIPLDIHAIYEHRDNFEGVRVWHYVYMLFALFIYDFKSYDGTFAYTKEQHEYMHIKYASQMQNIENLKSLFKKMISVIGNYKCNIHGQCIILHIQKLYEITYNIKNELITVLFDSHTLFSHTYSDNNIEYMLFPFIIYNDPCWVTYHLTIIDSIFEYFNILYIFASKCNICGYWGLVHFLRIWYILKKIYKIDVIQQPHSQLSIKNHILNIDNIKDMRSCTIIDLP
jgi:hypothetical protein